MEKQKKQLLLMIVLLVVVVAAFAGISAIPEEEEEAAVTYQLTDLEADNVEKLVYTYDDVHVELTKSGDEWLSVEDNSLDLDEDTINAMVKKIASVASENKIENVTDISIYGLDASTKNITVSDGTTEYVVTIGNLHDFTSTFYVYLNGDTGTVYTLTDTIVYNFDATIDELIAVEEETTEAETATVEAVVE